MLLIGVFYIPKLPVRGSLNIPNSGVRKVNKTNSREIKQSTATDSLGDLQLSLFSLNNFVS